MSVLTVREYTTIPVAHRFSNDPKGLSVSSGHLKRLAHLNRIYRRRARFEPVELRYQAIRTRQYVGVIGLGRDSIEILPKVEKGGDTQETVTIRSNLLRMLAVTRRLPIREAEVSRLATQDNHLLEILLRLYCEKLFAQLHRGLLNAYETFESNLPVLRGRLLLNAHLKHNIAHHERFFCQYDEFSVDNLLNRFLKAAARIAYANARTNITRTLGSQLLFALTAVSDKRVGLQEWKQLPRDRTTSRYDELLLLAAAILLGPYPEVVAGEDTQTALLFDMAELFEEFVGRKGINLSSRLGLAGRLQGPRKWLVQEVQEDGVTTDRFGLRPDIVFSAKGEVKIIADTKWKLIDPAQPAAQIQQGDIYQMLAYAKRYDCAETILIYPCALSTGAERRLATFRIDEVTVTIAGLDLRDLSTVDEQLMRIFAPLSPVNSLSS